jgi:hypothetical protein
MHETLREAWTDMLVEKQTELASTLLVAVLSPRARQGWRFVCLDEGCGEKSVPGNKM